MADIPEHPKIVLNFLSRVNLDSAEFAAIYMSVKELEAKKIAISISPKQYILLDSLVRVLGTFEDIEVTGIFKDIETTFLELNEIDCDILVVDFDLFAPKNDISTISNQMESQEDILGHPKTMNFPTKTIVLANSKNKSCIQTALTHGASSYLLKSVSINVLKVAIDKVFGGETFFPRDVAKEMEREEKIEVVVKLSRREKQVLKLVSTGHSSPEIAHILALHKDTVSDYRESLMKKLRAKNAADLIRIAYECALLSPY